MSPGMTMKLTLLPGMQQPRLVGYILDAWLGKKIRFELPLFSLLVVSQNYFVSKESQQLKVIHPLKAIPSQNVWVTMESQQLVIG